MQAVIFIGVQASGKSTFFKERFFDTHVRINLDMLKTRQREKVLLDACLQSKQSFVVDNTNPTVEDRKRYIIPAKEAKFEVIGYYFDSGINAALQRNQHRAGKQRIPEVGIRSTFHKLQLPTLVEGFDQLYSVKVDPDGLFRVEEWQDED
ncbi:MAG TPA: AAA family ATPase [Anaerolineales bacterium]